MLLDHVFITYSDGSYNETTRTYDPVDPLILAYTKDSLLFDTKRHTIYAQGIEFGYSYTFPYVNSGVGITGTDISKGVSYYIIGIEQRIDGSISYSYSYSYITFGLSDGILDNDSGGAYIIGMAMSDDGKISYKYADVNHTTTPTELSGNSLANHGIVVDVNINQQGALTYSYYNATTTDSDKTHEGNHDLSGAEYTVVDGLTQDSFGKISYHTTTIKTTHSGNVNGDFAYDLSLSNDGKLTGKSGVFSNQKTGDTTSGVINNVHIDNTGKLSYSYISLEDLLDVNPTSAQQVYNTILNNTSYQFITNIGQDANGSISYVYGYFNTTHTSTGIVDRDIDDRVITNVHLDADGNFSYSYADHTTTDNDRISPLVQVAGNIGTKDNATITLSHDNSYKFVTQIDQAADGKIIYTYAYVNTIHTTALSNEDHHKVVTYINLDANGNLSYHLTDLSVTNGTAGSDMVLTNDDTYKFITGITQASDGKISYTYSQLNTNFTYQGDNIAGPVYELNIDKTGKISYIHKNLTGNTGSYVSALTYTKGTHITYVPGSYIQFISGISQDADGKISYTYSAIYTDAYNNYRYHELNILERASTTADPQENTVEVLSTISTTNGNDKKHDISYTTIQVATKHYVDNLMTANDALRYAGIVTPSSTANGTVAFSKNDYSTGAVYKVSGNGYFGTEYVTGGDMVISYSDSANATSFANWNVINENIDLRTDTEVNAKNSNDTKKVITNVYLNDSGLLSYTTYNIGVQVVLNNDGESNELLGNTYTVITGVNLEQDGLDTKLSYNYTTLKVNANHHSTNPNTTHHDQAISYVWLNESGQLTYSAENLSSSAATPTTATLTNSNKYLVISSISQAANGKISYTAYELNTTHSNTNATNGSSSSVIGNVHLDANGTLSYSYVNIAQAAYHYTVNTNKTGDGNVISSIVVDDHGHLTTISYSSIAATDEYVYFKKVTDKIYLSGTDTQNGDVTAHSYIDGISYIQNKQLYTQVSYFNQSYVGQLKVTSTAYLDGNTYIGNDTTDRLQIVSKTIDFNSDDKTEFTHLKSLWGVVVVGQ